MVKAPFDQRPYHDLTYCQKYQEIEAEKISLGPQTDPEFGWSH